MPDAQTVYVDDSGTDPQSKIADASFCVATVERWLDFEDRWRKIADSAGFDIKHWHMTEFAACRPTNFCQQCLRQKTTAIEHPWRRWPDKKREAVLKRLAKALVATVEWAHGNSYTKSDFEQHIRDSPARSVAEDAIGDEHFTFAVQQCGGKLAEWRASTGQYPPLKFVFDLTSEKERYEIAKVFFARIENQDRIQNGLERWFEPEPNGVTFENRRSTVQLLAPDMIAWLIATLRARELYRVGRHVEMFQLAYVFTAENAKHMRIGYTNPQAFIEWEKATLNNAKMTQEDSQ